MGFFSSCDKRSEPGNSISPENIVISSKGDESKLDSYSKNGTVLIDVILDENGGKCLRLRNGMLSSVKLQVGDKKIHAPSGTRSITPLHLNKPEKFRIWFIKGGRWELKYSNVLLPEVSFHVAINHDGISKIPFDEEDDNHLGPDGE